ncbi:hypothetical protein VNI00_016415 [Paramarasmius palmivorus]|uniref:Uncharacterized protein n=1 Tax=Paramarasmius palmivorus TaxID=297713 RepID=A0AAW0BCR9_9AGAR
MPGSSPSTAWSVSSDSTFGLTRIEDDESAHSSLLAQEIEPEDMDDETLARELVDVMNDSVHYEYNEIETNGDSIGDSDDKPSFLSFVKDVNKDATIGGHLLRLNLYQGVNGELKDAEVQEIHTRSELEGLEVEAERIKVKLSVYRARLAREARQKQRLARVHRAMKRRVKRGTPSLVEYSS